MIGIGIIGYGYWGPNLARCFSEAENCRLVAIADAQTNSRARAARRYPAVEVVDDWQALIANPRVDAVVVATPVRTHHYLAMQALTAGKHVLVEKPMTESSDHAKTLIDEAARRDLTLMVDHTFVYTGAVRKMGELVGAGLVGDVYYYDSRRINLGLFQSDVNVLWDLAVHDLAILQYVLREQPLTVSATGACHVEGTPENMAHVTLYYASGAIAHLSTSWLAPVKVRQVLLGGSRKMVIYDDMETSEKIKVYDRGIHVSADPEEIRDMKVSYRMGDMWAPQISTKEALLTVAEHFLGCISDGRTPDTDGLVGLSVVEALEGATRSMRRRGQPVELSPLRKAS